MLEINFPPDFNGKYDIIEDYVSMAEVLFVFPFYLGLFIKDIIEEIKFYIISILVTTLLSRI